MHIAKVWSALTMAITVSVLVAGCTAESPDQAAPDTPPATANTDDHNHGHDHPAEGPHHGHLIELGDEEYHAELVHDEKAATVTIYILDAAAEETVPIEANEIAINLQHDGKGEQFKLTASPDEGDPEGKSSRFVSEEKELGEDLHAEEADAQLVVTINGKSYRGKIEHDHGHDDDDDHDGHDHDGDEHHETGGAAET